MFIFVGCAGGGTSSLFCQRMVTEINSNDENLRAVFADIEQVLRKQIAYSTNYDLVFAYGGIDCIRSYNAFDIGQLFDVVFLAPQVKFLLPSKVELLKEYPTIVKAIPMKLFGTMNSAQGRDLLLDELIDLDLRRNYQSQILVSSKSSDKDFEIFVAGLNSEDSYFTELLSLLDSQNIRVVKESFQLEILYDFHPEADFEIRFVFGGLSTLNEDMFSKVSRRIDAFILSSNAFRIFEKKTLWLDDYKIPYFVVNNPKSSKEKAELWDFLVNTQYQTEYTSAISVKRFEEKELPQRKSILFGLVTWESQERRSNG